MKITAKHLSKNEIFKHITKNKNSETLTQLHSSQQNQNTTGQAKNTKPAEAGFVLSVLHY